MTDRERELEDAADRYRRAYEREQQSVAAHTREIERINSDKHAHERELNDLRQVLVDHLGCGESLEECVVRVLEEHEASKDRAEEALGIAVIIYSAAMKSRSRKVKGIIRRLFGPLRKPDGVALAVARHERIEAERAEKRRQWDDLVSQRDRARAELADAWAALGTTAAETADDPDVARLPDAIRVALQYERDQRGLAQEVIDSAMADLPNVPGDHIIARARTAAQYIRDMARLIDALRAKLVVSWDESTDPEAPNPAGSHCIACDGQAPDYDDPAAGASTHCKPEHIKHADNCPVRPGYVLP